MKKNVNWYKYGVWVAAAIILILLVRSCGKGGSSFFSCNKPDTLRVRYDTTIYKDSFVYVDKPLPYRVDSFIYIKGKTVRDTIPELVIQQTDTAAIMKGFFETAYYSDVKKFKRGSVEIDDTVTQNRIVGHGVKIYFEDTTIKETITLQQPKKVILYFGLNTLSNRREFLYSIGGDLSLKGKNDMIYGAGVNIMRGGDVYYSGEVKFPIRFKNRK